MGAVEPLDLHDLHGVADRRQGIAKLVGEHGKELVLAQVGFFEGFLQALPLGDLALQLPLQGLVLPGNGMPGLVFPGHAPLLDSR